MRHYYLVRNSVGPLIDLSPCNDLAVAANIWRLFGPDMDSIQFSLPETIYAYAQLARLRPVEYYFTSRITPAGTHYFGAYLCALIRNIVKIMFVAISA